MRKVILLRYPDVVDFDSETTIAFNLKTKKNKISWPKDLTFADVDRAWALKGETGKYLQNVLPQDIWQDLKIAFLSGDLDCKEAQRVLKYFLANSVITSQVKETPSGAKIFNYLYHKWPVADTLDHFFVKSKSAKAIHKRLQTLRDVLPDMIRKEIKKFGIAKSQRYLIDNIGAGNAYDTIDMLIKDPDLADFIHVRCIDPDSEALEMSQKIVEELGFSDSFEFVAKKVEDVKPRRAHMLMFIGMLCPIKSRICVKILKGIKLFARLDGIVIFSTVQRKMIENDPLCDIIMRLAGWFMSFKEDNEPAQIARKAGWIPEGYFDDPMGFNRMTIARLPFDLKTFLKKIVLSD